MLLTKVNLSDYYDGDLNKADKKHISSLLAKISTVYYTTIATLKFVECNENLLKTLCARKNINCLPEIVHGQYTCIPQTNAAASKIYAY